MKQAIGIFAVILMMPSLSLQAWVGGPFSNDQYTTFGDDGIYEAIGTMTNGTGMFRWAVNNNNGGGIPFAQSNAQGSNTSNVQFGGLIGAQNPHVWYYKGLVYYGRCFGMVNSDMGIVSVTGNASVDGLDGSGASLNGVELSSAGVPQGQGAAGGIQTASPQPGGFQSNALGGLGNNKAWANSNFIATITEKEYSAIRFHGKGSVSFIGLPDNSIETTFVQRTPRRADRNADGQSDQQREFVHQELFGDSGTFSQFGHKRTFIVYGNRVSTTISG